MANYSTLDHALKYAAQGVSVIPLHYMTAQGVCSCGGVNSNPKCKPAKHPFGGLVPNGLKNASTDQNILTKWFKDTPYNIGIVTGKVSGFFVLDRDDRDGGDVTLKSWESEHGPLPETLTQKTGNGVHYLFLIPDGVEIRNIQKKINARGLDVRGEGGYICAAPTIHYSGNQYEWQNTEFFDLDLIKPAPDWLIEKITTPSTKSLALDIKRSPIFEAVLGKQFEIPKTIKDGEGRESFILSYASHLRAKGLDQATIESILLDYNKLRINPPLDEAEVIDRARRYYEAQPSTVSVQQSNWDNPKPIISSLPTVQEFDYALLPTVFHSWIKDIAERMQCPPDFLAVGAMVAAGAVIGNKIAIQPKQNDTGWYEVPNLWGAVIGRPGAMKSPALAQVLAPLKELEQDAAQSHSAEMAQYEMDKMIYEAQIASLKTQLKKGATTINPNLFPVEPSKPHAKRFLLNDATYQKVGEVLVGNPNGVLIFQDELTGLLTRLDVQGQESARAFYLQAWDGKQSYTFDRIERGTVSINKLCFSMLGGIQPSKINEYLRSAINGGKGDDGLCQRLQLMVYPDIAKDWVNVDRAPDAKAKKAFHDLFKQLGNINLTAIGATENSSGVYVLKFDDDAQQVFNSWLNRLETHLRHSDQHPALESHTSKYRKLIPCIALLDHLIQNKTGPIKIDSVMRAIDWHRYLKSHTNRVYALVNNANNESAKVLYNKLKSGQLDDEFTIRDVYRKNWSMLNDIKVATDAVEILVDHGWLSAYQDKLIGSDGRPTTRFIINPILKDSK